MLMFLVKNGFSFSLSVLSMSDCVCTSTESQSFALKFHYAVMGKADIEITV